MTTKTTARRGRGEGTRPVRRPDGRWQARVRLKGGRRKSVYGATSAECARKLRAVVRVLDGDKLPIGDKLTFGAFVKTWLDGKKRTLAPRSHKRYSELLHRHAVPALGRISLSKLEATDIDNVLIAKSATLSPRTVHHLRAAIRAVLTSALTKKLVVVNEATLTYAVRVDTEPVRATEPEEAAAIIDAVRGDRSEALYVTALYSGCRLGELSALTWRDVDLDGGMMTIRRSLGLGRDPKGEPIFTPPKKSVRTIWIPAAAVTALRAHRARQAVERLAAGRRWRDHDLVFASTIGTPLDGGDVLRSFRKLLKIAGIPAMRFHDLRHAYATLSLAAGEDLATVSSNLGHSNIATTANVYAHVLPRTKKNASARLEAFVMGVEQAG
jgi:integrase